MLDNLRGAASAWGAACARLNSKPSASTSRDISAEHDGV